MDKDTDLLTPPSQHQSRPKTQERYGQALADLIDDKLIDKKQELVRLILAKTLLNTHLFNHLSESQIERILTQATMHRCEPGETIVSQDDKASHVSIIIEGEATAYWGGPDSERHSRQRLKQYDVIGLLPLFDRGRHSATVKAKTSIELVQIPIRFLRQHIIALEYQNPIVRHAIDDISRKLRRANAFYSKNISDYNALKDVIVLHRIKHAKSEHNLSNASRMLIFTIISLGLYTLLISQMSSLMHWFDHSYKLTALLCLMYSGLTGVLIWRSNISGKRFGLSVKKALPKCLNALLFSMPFVMMMLVAKALLIEFHPGFKQAALFSGLAHFDFIGLLFYAFILAPAQEFIARSGLQSGFYLFLSGQHRALKAILLSNFIFCITHLYFSVWVVLLSFCLGLFWGTLFQYQRSLLAVSVSHAFLGSMFFFVIQFPGIVV